MKIKHLTVLTLAMLVCRNGMSQTNTNQLATLDISKAMAYMPPKEDGSVIVNITKDSMLRFNRLVEDHFIPPKRIDLLHHDEIDSGVQGRVSRAMEYGFRNWIEDYLSIKDGWLLSVLAKSVGSVEEEEIDTLNPNLQLAEESWWSKIRKNEHLIYGIKPFRTSPYVFVGADVRQNGKPLFYTHLRYYFDHLQNHKIEAIVSVPLMYDWKVTTGVAFNSEPSSAQSGRNMVGIMRLERPLSKGIDSYFFFGPKIGYASSITGGFGISF